MDLLAARQKIVASNIANADTPGYKTKDMDFQFEFMSLVKGGTPNVNEVSGLPTKNDGNNVSMDREARLLAENAVLRGDPLQLVEEEFRRKHVAAFALYRLDENGRDLFRCNHGPEELIFNKSDGGERAVFRRLARIAAVGIRKRGVKNAAEQRSKTLPLNGLAGRQRKRSQRAAVEASVKSDQLVASGVVARQFDRRLDRLSAGIAEIYAPGCVTWSNGGQFLRQLHHVLVVEVGPGHVDQAAGLALDRRDHVGVAVARGCHSNSGIEVEKAVAVDVFYHGAAAAFDDQRIAPGIRRGQHLRVPFDNRPRPRTGQGRDELRKIGSNCFIGQHRTPPQLSAVHRQGRSAMPETRLRKFNHLQRGKKARS